MSLTSPAFLGFAVLAIVLLRLLPGGSPRQGALLCLDAVFLYSQAGALMPLLPLVGFVLLGFVAILLAERRKLKRGLGLLVLGLVVVFIWLKRYPIVSSVPGFGFTYAVVGLSYMLFRILHIVIDVGQGSLQRPGFLTYLNYVFNFLCLLSGPISRLEEFAPQTQERPQALSWREVDVAIQRILAGYVMIVVLAAVSNNFVELLKPEFSAALAQGDVTHGIRVYALLCGTYLVNLYFNFAGYMGVVIGIGLLCGLKLPENFNAPFLSKSFLDLWSRWHITLSNWLKFYLFNAVLKALGERFGNKPNMPYLGAIAFFVTFVVMGVWHGTTYIFFVYGLFLGAGVTVNRLWQIVAPKWLGKEGYKRLLQRQWYFEVSRAATLSYLALALSSFWIADPQAVQLIHPQGLAIFAGALGALIAVGTVAGFLWDTLSGAFRGWVSRRWAKAEGDAPLQDESSRAGRALIASFIALGIASVGVAVGSLVLTGILSGSSTARRLTMLVLMSGALVAVLIGVGQLEPAIARWRDAALPRSGPDAAAAWAGVRALLVVNLAVLMASSIPDFIYKAF